MTLTDPFLDAGADYWRQELDAIERLLAVKQLAADAVAPFLDGQVAAALTAAPGAPLDAPDGSAAALARNFSLLVIAQDDVRRHRAERNRRFIAR